MKPGIASSSLSTKVKKRADDNRPPNAKTHNPFNLNSLLPIKLSKVHFLERYHFSPVKNVKKYMGRDLNTLLPLNT